MRKFTLVVFTCLISNVLSAQSSADNLLLHLKGDGNTEDASSYQNHGTIEGGVTLTEDRFGNENSAFLFNGIDGVIRVPYSESIGDIDSTISISLWLLVEEQLSDQHAGILHKFNAEQGSDYYLGFSYTGAERIHMHVRSSQNNSYAIAGTTPWELTVNKWHQLTYVVTYDSAFIYLDNQLTAQERYHKYAFWQSSGGDLLIGAHDNTAYEWKGKMDDIRIYNRALSSAEVDAIFNENNINTGITEQDYALSIYPNPVENVLHISNGNKGQVLIFNAMGQCMPIKWESKNSLDCSGYISGIYTLYLQDDSNLKTTQFMVR